MSYMLILYHECGVIASKLVQRSKMTKRSRPLSQSAFIPSRKKRFHATAKIRSTRRSPQRRGNAKSLNPRGESFGAARRSAAYVYAILVDGVVRYIGKGRNVRMYTHLIEAKRSAARCARDTSGLYPRMHRKLVEAVRAGSQITETVVTSGLTDRTAYRLESRIICEFHKFRSGQLWNTIDERFLDPRFLPDEWDDPEYPLYKLPRPLFPPHTRKSRDGIARDQALEQALKALGWKRGAGIARRDGSKSIAKLPVRLRGGAS
jgi:hypothetical protein